MTEMLLLLLSSDIAGRVVVRRMTGVRTVWVLEQS
jgi:hypothetical protein